jgi:hypothetical protein
MRVSARDGSGRAERGVDEETAEERRRAKYLAGAAANAARPQATRERECGRARREAACARPTANYKGRQGSAPRAARARGSRARDSGAGPGIGSTCFDPELKRVRPIQLSALLLRLVYIIIVSGKIARPALPLFAPLHCTCGICRLRRHVFPTAIQPTHDVPDREEDPVSSCSS